MPKTVPKRPKMGSKIIWTDEAVRIVIRYNFERGLTVRECVDEMHPHFKSFYFISAEEQFLRIYRLYRELHHGIYYKVGNDEVPASPEQSTRLKEAAALNQTDSEEEEEMEKKIDVDNDSDIMDADAPEDNDADQSSSAEE